MLLSDPSDLLAGTGAAGFIRTGRAPGRPVGFVVDFWLQHIPRNNDIVSGPCPPSTSCPEIFLGPTTILTVAPAFEAAVHDSGGTLLLHVGPALSWFLATKDGTAPVEAALRAGLGVRLGRGSAALLLSVDYLRFIGGVARPRWQLPITLGCQFRARGP